MNMVKLQVTKLMQVRIRVRIRVRVGVRVRVRDRVRLVIKPTHYLDYH